jgi:hypothetical protein
VAEDPMHCERCGQPHDRCKAHNRAGGPCQQRPMKGQLVCKNHGGKSPGARERAAERLQQEAAEKALRAIWNPNAEPVTDSVSEMRRLAGSLRQAVDVVGAQLSHGDVCEECGRGSLDLDSVTAAAWTRLLREQRTLLAEMERLGIANRYQQMTEELAGQVAGDIEIVVRRILERLGLEERQLVLVPVVVPEELRRAAIALPSAEGEAS